MGNAEQYVLNADIILIGGKETLSADSSAPAYRSSAKNSLDASATASPSASQQPALSAGGLVQQGEQCASPFGFGSTHKSGSISQVGA